MPDLGRLRELVLRHTGVILDADREGLLEARLTTLFRRRPELERSAALAALDDRPDAPELIEICEALTNGETSFFREPLMFDELRGWVLPELARRRDRLELWCAACSTGQEPYSLAMLIATWFPELLEPGRVRIIASDVSRHNLAVADAATYTRAQINRGLPAAMLVRWFDALSGESPRWRLRRQLRELVELRHLNLLRPWPLLPPFDLILLRNVIVYWSEADRRQVLERARSKLTGEAYLALGGAELLPRDLDLRVVQRQRWRFYARPPLA